MNMVLATRLDIAEQLHMYGEDELANAMLVASDKQWHDVMTAASSPDLAPDQDLTIDHLLARAAIAVLTGIPRAPKRKRRRAAASGTSFCEDLAAHHRERAYYDRLFLRDL